MPGRQVFVALLVLPTVISPIVAGATWRLLFDNRFGPINQILGWFAGRAGDAAVDDQSAASSIRRSSSARSGSGRRSCSCCCSPRCPMSTSRSSKPPRSTAPATGAPSVRIVLPAIWPVMAIAILIRGLDLFRLFDIVWALTEGGPGTMTETISIFTYVQGFQQFETSYTAAIAFLVIVLLSVVVTWAHQARWSSRDERARPSHRRSASGSPLRYAGRGRADARSSCSRSTGCS